MTDHSDLIARLRHADQHSQQRVWGSRIFDEAASALSSQSLSLSEAREEIERLKKERDAIRQEAHEVVLSMIFMPGVRKALDALPEDDPVEPYIARIRELEAKEARLAALENSKAGLADAKNDPADSDLSSLREGDGTTYPRLSSLRKDAVGPAVSEGGRGHSAPVTSGAEVAVKQIDWRDMTYKGVEEWVGHCALSQSFTIKDEGEDRLPYRFTVRPFLSGVTSFPTADEAKAAAQSDFETRIRSALVSGSREDGADAP